MQKPFAITQGDAAGIGPEIIAKAFQVAPEAMRGGRPKARAKAA